MTVIAGVAKWAGECVQVGGGEARVEGISSGYSGNFLFNPVVICSVLTWAIRCTGGELPLHAGNWSRTQVSKLFTQVFLEAVDAKKV